jgi:cytochrome o ubiquinol oxidase subunit 1
VNAVFGLATMIIAVPTGVKVFNWLFTMYRGRVRFPTPMLWTLGFMVTFVIGGMTGVLMAIPPADFVLHNSQFLVAHFHNTIIGSVVFGCFAGFTYWFPKAFGFRLNETLGKCSFWCWLVGFYLAFMPLYILGLMGMTRRLNHYDNPAWHPYLIAAAIGAGLILSGIIFQIVQLVVSIAQREKNLDLTGDPWNGRTLEWSVSSPPPAYNFAEIPVVRCRDAFWEMKQQGAIQTIGKLKGIHMPRNTSTGLVIGGFSLVLGFALVWQIWWMAVFGVLGIVISAMVHSFNQNREYYLWAEDVARIQGFRSPILASQG